MHVLYSEAMETQQTLLYIVNVTSEFTCYVITGESGFPRQAHIDDLDTHSTVFVTAHEWLCVAQKGAGITPAGLPLIKTVRLGRPCCGTVVCLCVPQYVCTVCVLCGWMCCTLRSSLHSRNPPGLCKPVIRKTRGSCSEKNGSRWRTLFFNEIFDIFFVWRGGTKGAD